MKPLNRQFREIKFPANTIFLRDREIKDSRNVPRNRDTNNERSLNFIGKYAL